MAAKFLVEGTAPRCCVSEGKRRGLVVYDLIETEAEARIICAVLNKGIGPEWFKIQDEVHRRLHRTRALSAKEVARA